MLEAYTKKLEVEIVCYAGGGISLKTPNFSVVENYEVFSIQSLKKFLVQVIVIES